MRKNTIFVTVATEDIGKPAAIELATPNNNAGILIHGKSKEKPDKSSGENPNP